MLRRSRAVFKELLLDFLPGEPIRVALKPTKHQTADAVVRGVDSIAESTDRPDKETREFQEYFQKTFETELAAMGEHTFDGVTTTSASDLQQYVHKPVYRLQNKDTPSDILAEINRFRTKSMHRMFTAQKTWHLPKPPKRKIRSDNISLWFNIRKRRTYPAPKEVRIKQYLTVKTIWRVGLKGFKRSLAKRSSRAKKRRRQIWEAFSVFDSFAGDVKEGRMHSGSRVDEMIRRLPAGKILETFRENGVTLSDGPLAAIVSSIPPVVDPFVRSGQLELRRLQQLYVEICKEHNPKEKTHTAAIELLCNSSSYRAAIRLLLVHAKEKVFTSCIPFRAVLKKYKFLKRADFMQVWNTMITEEITPDASCWECVIRAEMEVNFVFGVRAYRTAMKATPRPHFPEVLYCDLLSRAPAEMGYAVFSEMQLRGVPRTADLAKAWLDVCRANLDLDTALSCGSLLAEEGIPVWGAVAKVAWCVEEYSTVTDLVMPLHVAAGEVGGLSREVLHILLDSVSNGDPELLDIPEEVYPVSFPPDGLGVPV